jgi:hypothetical protein
MAAIFNPIEPHVGVNAKDEQVKNPDHIRIPFPNAKGVVQHVILPMAQFNAIKAQFQPLYDQVVGAPQQAQTVDEGMASASPSPQNFVAGKAYRDAAGNTATFNQDGTWTQH